jgi:hypothetical protein
MTSKNSPRDTFLAAQLLKGNKISSPRADPVEFRKRYDNPIRRIEGGVPPEKINNLLEEYDEIPPSEWESIKLGTRIRYLKDGDLKPGGYVRVNKPDYLVIENIKFGNKNKYPKYINWPVKIDNISKIFVKKKDDELPPPAPVQPQISTLAPAPIPAPIQPQIPTLAPAPIQPAPYAIATYNPAVQVENEFMQKQYDELEKKFSELEQKYHKLSEQNADIIIFVKKIGEYIKSKGINLDFNPGGK